MKKYKLIILKNILDSIITYLFLAIIDIILYLSIAYVLSMFNTSLFYTDFIKWVLIVIFSIYTIRLLVDIWVKYF